MSMCTKYNAALLSYQMFHITDTLQTKEVHPWCHLQPREGCPPLCSLQVILPVGAGYRALCPGIQSGTAKETAPPGDWNEARGSQKQTASEGGSTSGGQCKCLAYHIYHCSLSVHLRSVSFAMAVLCHSTMKGYCHGDVSMIHMVTKQGPVFNSLNGRHLVAQPPQFFGSNKLQFVTFKLHYACMCSILIVWVSK